MLLCTPFWVRQVHYPQERPSADTSTDAAAAAAMDWQELAGYEEQKRAIEDCLLLPLQHPEVCVVTTTQAAGHPEGN
jgi:hypothetical protein